MKTGSLRTWLWGALSLLGGLPLTAFDVATGVDPDLVVAWEPGPITMNIMVSAETTLSDGTNAQSSVIAALEAWNPHVGLVQFDAVLGQGSDYGIWNGSNEAVMDSTIGGFEFGEFTLAVAVYRNEGDRRVESDVVFNTAWNWDSYRGPLRDGAEDIRRVAIHEFGHVLGLLHPDQADPPQNVTAIMNAFVSDLDGLQADDIAGAQWLYGSPGFKPSNDDFSNATEISLEGTTTELVGTNIGASNESGEPQHADALQSGSVWWSWTAPASGSITISTQGSNFDTVLAVYTGDSVGNLVEVSSNDDISSGVVRTSAVTFAAAADESYRIAVSGWDGLTGNIRLKFLRSAQTGPSFIVQPRDQLIGYGSSAQFAADARGQGQLTYQWQRSSAVGWGDLDEADSDYSGTTSNTLTVSGIEALRDGTRYRLVATDSYGSTASDFATLYVRESFPSVSAVSGERQVGQGGTIQLSVTASGSSSLNYQWFLDGAEVPGSVGRFATLRLTNAQPRHAGSYRVRVSSEFGSVWSEAVEVTVETGPGVVRATEGRFVRQDGSYMLIGTDGPRPSDERSLVVFADNARSDEFTIDVQNALTGNHPQQGRNTLLAENVSVTSTETYVDRDGALLEFPRTIPYATLVQVPYFGGYLDAFGQVWELNFYNDAGRDFVMDGVMDVAGISHSSVFLKADGTAWVWGGFGTTSFPEPSDIGLVDVVDVAAGILHALFLTADGTLWGIGRNSNGELGTGDKSEVTELHQMDTGVFAIAAGERESLWIKNDGSLWGTGRAARDTLGIREFPVLPVLIADGPLSVLPAPASIEASDDTPLEAIRLNWSPVLGASFYEVWRSSTDDLASAEILRTRLEGTHFMDGTSAPGTVYYYWVRAVNPAGSGAFSPSEPGQRSNVPPSFSAGPQSVRTLSGQNVLFHADATGTPHPALQWQIRESGSSNWEDLSNDATYSGVTENTLRIENIGVAVDGLAVRCTASNVAGTAYSGIAEISVSPESRVIEAEAGSSIHFITSDGTLWGRGFNPYGNVGDGTTFDRSFAVEIMRNVATVSAWGYTTLFLRTDGTLWGVGANDFQQLGSTLPETVTSPVQLAEDVVAMSAGDHFITFIKSDGSLWIAGESVLESDGVLRVLDQPRMVATQVLSASAGRGHCLFVKADGSLWAGGGQHFGRLGNGVVSESYSRGPVRVVESGVIEASAGDLFSVFLKHDGSLWGVGSNRLRQLNDASDTRYLAPIMIAEDVVEAHAGFVHLVYLTGQGDMRGSGSNFEGQLGSTEQSGIPDTLLRSDVRAIWSGLSNSLYLDGTGVLFGVGSNYGNGISESDELKISEFTAIAGNGLGTALPASPVRISPGATSDQLVLSWPPQAGDANYEIWRGVSGSFESATRLAANWRGNLFYDSPPWGGVEYSYWVVANLWSGESRASVRVVGSRPVREGLTVSDMVLAAAIQGSEIELDVISDTIWSATSSADWISLTPAEGQGNGTITIMVEFNDSEVDRNATVLVNGTEISVSQAANRIGPPAFILEPASAVAAAGSTVRLLAEVRGLPRPDLQWYRDGLLLEGETMTFLELDNVSDSDEGTYVLRATNPNGSSESAGAVITLLDETGVVSASHQIEDDLAPFPGGTVSVRNQLTVPPSATTIRWSVLLNEGWQITASRESEAPSSRPSEGDFDLLEWSWGSLSETSLEFSYTLLVPDGEALDAEVSAYVVVNLDDGPTGVLARPDPLTIPVRAPHHSADTNGDWRLSLIELLRVIEIYNTRAGSTRTGRYRESDSTEDGYAPDADGNGNMPTRFHSADSNRDARFSLSELLRVIELYNTRSGTSRTGQYRSSVGTEDGFAPDVL